MNPDSTTVHSIVGLDPSSPLAQLVYPLVITLLTAIVHGVKTLLTNQKFGPWVLRGLALLAGVGNATVVNHQALSGSTIAIGLGLGLAAIGGWEVLLGPIWDRLKPVIMKAPATPVIALAAVMLLAAPAHAQVRSNYPPLDWHRANFGASVGATGYDATAAAALGSTEHPRSYDLNLGGQFSYSTGPAIALIASAERDVNGKVGDVGEGVSWALSSDGVGSGLQVFARVRAVQYSGANSASITEKKHSVDFALPVSWRLGVTKSKKFAWYLRLVPSVDLQNPRRNAIRATFQSGFTPVPPQ